MSFLVNRAFNLCDQNRFAIDKAGQLVLMTLQSVARILSGVQYPSVILTPLAHASIKTGIVNELHAFVRVVVVLLA